MKILSIVFIIFFLSSCSFDNKSGIWKNSNEISKKNNENFKDYKKLSKENEVFESIISYNKNNTFKISSAIVSNNWKDIYYKKNNNFKNFKYSNENSISHKSKKISRSKLKNHILYESGNIILTDERGNLFVYSAPQKKIILKFNFYKKKYKKIKKNLNTIIENEIIYVSDNLGYLYSFNIKTNNLIWAKNYKVPFRSNLKIEGNNLIAANQDNYLYFFDKKNGEIVKLFPTEKNEVKNNFINNLSVSDNYTFFLNTYGSLYSLVNQSLKVNWFVNLNRSIDLNPSNLFTSNQVINYKNKVIVPSNNYLYVLNNNGSIKYRKNFSSFIKPIIQNDKLFIITKNNFLICMELNNGNIIYSYDLDLKISQFINSKPKNSKFLSLMILNSKAVLFLENSYYLQLSINGNIEKIAKLPSKINSNPIVVQEQLIFIDKSNKINFLN